LLLGRDRRELPAWADVARSVMSLRYRGAGEVEPAYATTELLRDSLVEFVAGDVACRVQFVVADRDRKVAMYDVLLANKRDVGVSCRLYGLDGAQRANDIAVFDVAGNSQGRSRFTVPFGRRDQSQRVYIEISGDGIAMLFETRLPRPKPVAPVGRIVLAIVALGIAGALLFYVLHFLRPAAASLLHPSATTIGRAPVVALASRPPAAAAPASVAYHQIDDAAKRAPDDFVFLGSWEHTRNMHDGRSLGTSSRSFHVGDMAYFNFKGERFKIFGIRGPGGGFAELSIDGQPSAMLGFYAPRKAAGVEVYESPALPAGQHAVDIVVVDAVHDPAKRRYVNIDGAAYAAH
jgi:hypothetical protein